MDGYSLGKAMANYVAALVFAAVAVGIVIGGVLFVGVPWLWHFIGTAK